MQYIECQKCHCLQKIVENALNYCLIKTNVSRNTLICIIGQLNKTFISIGALNDTCDFDKVVFSLRESSENELIFNCVTIETDIRAEEPEFPHFPGGGIAVTEAISFELLPIEIRVYN